MKVFGFIVLILPILAIIYCGWAAVVMLAVGMVHWQWLAVMPTMGYHAALALAWIPGTIFGGSAAAASNRRD